jgi:beta-glucosidase/6-phospho-beta-glucosidase/beta-galactosidase
MQSIPTRDLRDGFHWAVGMEDTFIGHPTRSGRVLDEYELIGHYDRWRPDLDLVASSGVRTLRYGIPWYRVNPSPGVFDWSWTDGVVEHLERIGLEPIVDLMHYGTPLWLERSFVDPAYVDSVTTYAQAFAERYGSFARWYTPLNEPIVNSFWCGQSGVWPPHLRGERGYLRVLLAIAAGVQSTIRVLREAVPEATIVQVEASESVVPDDPSLAESARRRTLGSYLPTDLITGAVDDHHELVPWLLRQEVETAALAALRAGAERVDVMGVNFYPHISCRAVGGTPESHRFRNRYGNGDDLAEVLAGYSRRYDVPVMITETSDTSVRFGRRARWMDESIRGVTLARENGVPVVGYTWFPVFSLIDWRYRRGRLPMDRYWRHMGLWDLRPDGSGGYDRVETPLVARYREYVARGTEAVGSVGAVEEAA